MEPNQEQNPGSNQSPLNNQLVPLSIVVAGGLIALAVYFGGGGNGLVTPTIDELNTDTESLEIAPITEKDHILGSGNAELIIVEYSDTECPYCKVFHNTMHQIVTEYEGKVAWVYRHFPIAQLHSKANKEAEATECASELGGNQIFWRYIDKIFETTNSNDSLDLAELPKIAVAVGLNEAAFETCLSSGKYREFITKSVEDSIKAGARGTPYSIILTKDGKRVIINGAEPVLTIRTKIDALLK